jgi:hypothetical protein
MGLRGVLWPTSVQGPTLGQGGPLFSENCASEFCVSLSLGKVLLPLMFSQGAHDNALVSTTGGVYLSFGLLFWFAVVLAKAGGTPHQLSMTGKRKYGFLPGRCIQSGREREARWLLSAG